MNKFIGWLSTLTIALLLTFTVLVVSIAIVKYVPDVVVLPLDYLWEMI